MDRDLLYPGQIGLVENFLDAFKNAMVAIGITSEAVLGQSTQVFGLAASPLSNTAVAGSAFAISIDRGAIFSYQETDANAYGVLGTDSTMLLKSGINMSAVSVGITNAAPPPPGYSINYLVAAQFQETDTNSVNLPFYNGGGSPTVNTENGTRTQRVVFSVTGGTLASTGTQNTPSAPAGSVPLYVVTISNGQTAVTAGDISVAPGAPYVTTIPTLVSGVNTVTENLASEVSTRTQQAGNLKTAINVYSNTTLTQPQQGSFVEIAAGSAVTTTLPTPVGQAGALFRFFNSSSYTQSLRTAASNFTGAGGNGTAGISLPAGQMVDVTSDNATWVVAPIGASSSRYAANQSGTITVAENTTYPIATVTVTFPSYSQTGAFRVRGRMMGSGVMTGNGTFRQNFQPTLSDGTNTIVGADWLVTSAYISDSWATSDYFQSLSTYLPGAVVTFAMSITTAGGNTEFTIAGSFFELYVVEA